MTSPETLLEIARAFAAAEVRWLVVGGYAVIAHGYVRMTKDLDLIIDFEAENMRKGLDALTALGFKPRVPVPLAQFADAGLRRRWQEEKDMVAFTVWRDRHGGLEQIDLFIYEPFPMREALPAALWQEQDGVRVPFVDLDRLLQMKRTANRDKDQLDIRRLEWIRSERRGT